MLGPPLELNRASGCALFSLMHEQALLLLLVELPSGQRFPDEKPVLTVMATKLGGGGWGGGQGYDKKGEGKEPRG